MNKSVKWQKTALIILCAVLALILVLMTFGTVYVHYLLSLLGRGDPGESPTLSPEDLATATESLDPNYTGPIMNPDDVTLNTLPEGSLPIENPKEIVNILLVGQDRRPGEPRQRSDAMILCTFNKGNNTITMTSFLRDTYVFIPRHGKDKLNAAYMYGDFPLLCETLAANFGVHVDACFGVDFGAFESIIDLLGGVNIQLNDGEAKFINNHLGYEAVTAGWQTLTGQEALLYSRNRSTPTITGNNYDYGRTERQRRVISAIISAYKDKSMAEMLGLLDDILPKFSVDPGTSNEDILRYAGSLFPMLAQSEIQNLQIPAAGTFESVDRIDNVADCLWPDLDANREILWDMGIIMTGN